MEVLGTRSKQDGKSGVKKTDELKQAGKSRRIFLQSIAAIPLAATLGLLASPLLRYLRPTLKPLDIFW